MKRDNLENIARLTPVPIDQIPATFRSRDIRLDIDSISVSVPTSPDEQLMGVIFAPDPVTGFATSDLSVFLSEKTSPEVRDYIKKFIFNEVPKAETGSLDPDVVLDATVSTRVQSPADWLQVQRDLSEIADLSAEQYKTWLLEHKTKN